METYAQTPGGIILPYQMAQTAVSSLMQNVWGHGAYRTASSSNKNTALWDVSHGSADSDSLGDLNLIRRQSRDLIRNEALPAGAINTLVTGVVGQGIVPQSRIDAEFLGLDEEQKAKFERDAERIFNHIALKPSFDSEGKLNFYQQQRLVCRSAKESGDIFALRRYIKRKGKALGVSVQLIEADRCDTPLTKTNDYSIRSGIQADENGAPEFYYIMQQHPGEAMTLQTNFTKIPAQDKRGEPLMLHVKATLRPGQTRGIPYLAPVIELFKQLGRYTEAEVTAAVVSGMMAVFVTTPAAGTTGGPLPMGLLPGQVGMPTNSVPAGNKIAKMQSGMVVDLLPGEDIKVAEAGRPNTAFEAFCNSVLSYIGTALGIPRDVLTKNYNSSYSAARAALQDAYRAFMVERDDLNVQFNQPVWNWVMDEAVALGLLDAPGYFDNPMIRDAYQAAEWIGPAMQSLDPGKDAAAATAWVTLGVKSRQDVSGEIGKDFDSTYRQSVKEKKMLDSAGLVRVENQNLQIAETKAAASQPDQTNNGGNP